MRKKGDSIVKSNGNAKIGDIIKVKVTAADAYDLSTVQQEVF